MIIIPKDLQTAWETSPSASYKAPRGVAGVPEPAGAEGFEPTQAYEGWEATAYEGSEASEDEGLEVLGAEGEESTEGECFDLTEVEGVEAIKGEDLEARDVEGSEREEAEGSEARVSSSFPSGREEGLEAGEMEGLEEVREAGGSGTVAVARADKQHSRRAKPPAHHLLRHLLKHIWAAPATHLVPNPNPKLVLQEKQRREKFSYVDDHGQPMVFVTLSHQGQLQTLAFPATDAGSTHSLRVWVPAQTICLCFGIILADRTTDAHDYPGSSTSGQSGTPAKGISPTTAIGTAESFPVAPPTAENGRSAAARCPVLATSPAALSRIDVCPSPTAAAGAAAERGSAAICPVAGTSSTAEHVSAASVQLWARRQGGYYDLVAPVITQSEAGFMVRPGRYEVTFLGMGDQRPQDRVPTRGTGHWRHQPRGTGHCPCNTYPEGYRRAHARQNATSPIPWAPPQPCQPHQPRQPRQPPHVPRKRSAARAPEEIRCVATLVHDACGGITSLTVGEGVFCSGTNNGSVKVWSASNYRCLATLPAAHGGCVSALAMDGHGQVLYSGSTEEGEVKGWHLNGRYYTQAARLAEAGEDEGGTFQHAVAVGDDAIYTGASDSTIKIWSKSNSRYVASLAGHTQAVRALALGTDGRLFSASLDRTVKVWSTTHRRCLATLTGHSRYVYSVVVGDGVLYSGSYDGTIKAWSLADYSCLASLTGHTGCVHALAITEGLLWSGSSDKTIKVWSLRSHTCLATLECHADAVLALAVGDGVVYSGALDETVKVWLVPEGMYDVQTAQTTDHDPEID
eukprot:jgi/Mesvir1/16290/Mv13022-RA.1